MADFFPAPAGRRATLEQYGAAFDYLISIHALREEGD
mgnify:CR=1 FL=1